MAEKPNLAKLTLQCRNKKLKCWEILVFIFSVSDDVDMFQRRHQDGTGCPHTADSVSEPGRATDTESLINVDG